MNKVDLFDIQNISILGSGYYSRFKKMNVDYSTFKIFECWVQFDIQDSKVE